MKKDILLRTNTAQARRDSAALQQLARESRVTPEAEAHTIAALAGRQGRVSVPITNGEPVILMLRNQGLVVTPLGGRQYEVLNKRVAVRPAAAVAGTNIGSLQVWNNWGGK